MAAETEHAICGCRFVVALCGEDDREWHRWMVRGGGVLKRCWSRWVAARWRKKVALSVVRGAAELARSVVARCSCVVVCELRRRGCVKV